MLMKMLNTKEIIHKDNEKVFTIEEENKTLEYQETINLDIKNIDSTKQQIWRSIYEIIYGDYFKAVKLFPSKLLNQYKNKQN